MSKIYQHLIELLDCILYYLYFNIFFKCSGNCVNIQDDYHVNYTLVLKHSQCYYCVKLLVRTVNVLEKIETPCVNLAPNEEPTVSRVCRGLNPDQQLITLFNENYIPVRCYK